MAQIKEEMKLQWGRGQLTADDNATTILGGLIARLQWGRGQLTADDRNTSNTAIIVGPKLQWGRGQLTADDPAIA